jgi:hypothetical protein
VRLEPLALQAARAAPEGLTCWSAGCIFTVWLSSLRWPRLRCFCFSFAWLRFCFFFAFLAAASSASDGARSASRRLPPSLPAPSIVGCPTSLCCARNWLAAKTPHARRQATSSSSSTLHSPTAGHARSEPRRRARRRCLLRLPLQISKKTTVVAGHCYVMEMTTSEAVLALLRSVCQAARLRS